MRRTSLSVLCWKHVVLGAVLTVLSASQMRICYAQDVAPPPPDEQYEPEQDLKTDQQPGRAKLPELDELQPPVIEVPESGNPDGSDVSPFQEWLKSRTDRGGLKRGPAPQLKTAAPFSLQWEPASDHYADPKNRFIIHYEKQDPKLTIEMITTRFERALAIHMREDQMGKCKIDEPIHIYIGSYKFESAREVPDTQIAAVTTIEASHVVIKAPPEQATVENFRHELTHWRMMTEGYVNVPYWISEGLSHFYEAEGGYNHNMWRWICFEGPMTDERLGGGHSSSNDSMRRRATGWALCFYYERHLGESWQQICRRTKHVDPKVAWAWVQDHFDEKDLAQQVSRLEKREAAIPPTLMARLTEIRGRLSDAEAVRVGTKADSHVMR